MKKIDGNNENVEKKKHKKRKCQTTTGKKKSVFNHNNAGKFQFFMTKFIIILFKIKIVQSDITYTPCFHNFKDKSTPLKEQRCLENCACMKRGRCDKFCNCDPALCEIRFIFQFF